MQVLGVIPARLESSRLPKKLLLNETGKSIIQHTWEAASQAQVLQGDSSIQLVVATDSLAIAAEVQRFNGQVEMTGDHPSGTDRIAEIVRRSYSDVDIIVNIQGDEPDIDPAAIDLVASLLIDQPECEMATLCTPITDASILNDPSCVKAVVAEDGRALYFSRSCVPFVRDANATDLLDENSPWRLHLGIYAYRRDFLLRMTDHAPSQLEKLEKLEQLRALEMGATIKIADVETPAVGIDTPEDYRRFVTHYRAA
jgi:3-deoxy-manno-octulosonate cytidylyltransferase (CMP-KDO synthetase)